MANTTTSNKSSHSPSTTPSFQYEPLDLTKQQIRLVEIPALSSQRGSKSPLHLRIWNQDFKDAKYRALSYAWGPPPSTRTIYLNDRPFAIRENLYEFLLVARKDSELPNTAFWIDQLCIDQENNSEKNHQVSMLPNHCLSCL